MADYPTIDPRAFGNGYAVPNAVSRLPVNLLRTALVTRDPAASAQAMSEYRQQANAPQFVPTTVLPQRMMFQQHKHVAGGVARGGHAAAISSAATLSRALPPQMPPVFGLSASGLVQTRIPERVPTYDQAQAANARGAQVMPQPEISAPLPPVVASRVRPLRQPIAPPPEAYGVALREAESMRAAAEAERSGNAMRSVAQAKESIRQLLGFR